MDRILAILRKALGFDALVEFSKKKRFPGHKDISWYEVVSFLVNELKRDAIDVRAASVSFSLFASLFPTLLMLFTLIPFIPIPSFETIVMEDIRRVVPDEVYAMIESTVLDVLVSERIGLFSVSLVLAFYFSSRGVISLMQSFDKALPTFRHRNWLNKQLVAFKLLGLFLLLLGVSVGLTIGGEYLVQLVMETFSFKSMDTYFWFTVLRWGILIFVFYVGISLIYYYAPATHERWSFFSVGSTLATILCLLISVLFSWMIDEFGQYNKLYGSIGAVLVAQLWIYYNALSLLIGFELNASIEINEQSKIVKPPEGTSTLKPL